MRKKVFGRKLKRDANERKALLKGLMTDLVMKERIQTTEEKAKAIRSGVEKLITKAKTRTNAAVLLQQYLTLEAVEKVMNDLSKRFATRPGGYVRIVKLGKRFGDNASMAVIEWVEKTSARVVSESRSKKQEVSKKTKSEKVESVIASKAKQSAKKSSKVTKKETKTKVSEKTK